MGTFLKSLTVYWAGLQDIFSNKLAEAEVDMEKNVAQNFERNQVQKGPHCTLININ